MWQFVFDDKTLLSDFVELLIAEGALAEESRSSFESVSSFISLYALNIMHGARLKMADGKMAQLRLAASEEFGFLRIKAEIQVSDNTKPLTTSVPIFETALMADDHCAPQILTIIDDPVTAEIGREQPIWLR